MSTEPVNRKRKTQPNGELDQQPAAKKPDTDAYTLTLSESPAPAAAARPEEHKTELVTETDIKGIGQALLAHFDQMTTYAQDGSKDPIHLLGPMMTMSKRNAALKSTLESWSKLLRRFSDLDYALSVGSDINTVQPMIGSISANMREDVASMQRDTHVSKDPELARLCQAVSHKVERLIQRFS
jgi:hypothetical protein